VYRDASSFSRAFWRWTGTTLRAYRNQSLGQHGMNTSRISSFRSRMMILPSNARDNPDLTYLRPEWDSFGSGLEAYHSVNEHFSKKGGGAVIYSCLPISERTGLKVPMIMSFEKNYPIPLKEKVIANMKRWGFK
jgi:hypothetical protein